jgi:hypothetical protein
MKYKLFAVLLLSMFLSSCRMEEIKEQGVKRYKDAAHAVSFNLIIEDTEAVQVIYDYYRFVEQKKFDDYIKLRTEYERLKRDPSGVLEETYVKSASIRGIQFMKDIVQAPDLQIYKVDLNITYWNVPEQFQQIYIDGDKTVYVRMKKEDSGWKIYLIGNTI